MQNQEESILYGLRLLIRVLGVLLLFNIVNGVGTVVNEYKNSRHPNVEVQIDTCIIHDTIIVEKPILQKVAMTDTLRLPVLARDTLMLHDTVFVTLPIEQRQTETLATPPGSPATGPSSTASISISKRNTSPKKSRLIPSPSAGALVSKPGTESLCTTTRSSLLHTSA